MIALNRPPIFGGVLINGIRRLSQCYDGEDPAPRFFSQPIQRVLRYLTRPDPAKIFRKRRDYRDKVLETPKYKFLTDEQLAAEMEKARATAERFLRMPPVLKAHRDVERILSRDPGIAGHSTATFVFTDITYGLRMEDRMIVVREPDGTLKHADYETKKRLVQTYFPLPGRQLKEPQMFTDEQLFNDLLKRKEYEFILESACAQYEPEEPKFQTVNSKVFRQCDATAEYEALRSTRHFGPMAFCFGWNNTIDGLLLELLRAGIVREATALINLQRCIHPDIVKNDDSEPLIEEILKRTDFWGRCEPSKFTDSDVDLDEHCFGCVGNYIKNNSTRKAQQELALESLHEIYKRQIKAERGVQSAHGKVA